MPPLLTNEQQQAAALVNLGSTSAEDRARQLARALINTKFYPPAFVALRQWAIEAEAYHNLRPYPYWQFQDWKTEDRGPLPRCLPLARRIVCKGAKWLFGKPIQINLPSNTTLEAWLRAMWQKNRMPTKMVAAAEKAGQQGGIALKWSYDETSPVPLSFQLLSVVDECRLFYDPHDCDRLLMARVQYPVFNAADGKTYLYREEWTDEEEVHFQPIEATYTNLARTTAGGFLPYAQLPVLVMPDRKDPDLHAWEVTSQKANPFGCIPLHPLRNRDIGREYGLGDLVTDNAGGMFRVLDRINLTFHNMDRSNQFDSIPTTAAIDLAADPGDLDKPLKPGDILSLKSEGLDIDGKTRGSLQMIEPRGALRPHMMEYAKELRQEILATVGSVDVREDEVTNKGNLTQAVLTQLYAPLIETTEEKRKTYGEDGIAKFLERCACGLKRFSENDGTPRIAEVKGVREENEDTHDVQLKWSDYFPLTEEEKQTKLLRVDTEVQQGYTTHERAIEVIAVMEGVEDIGKLKKELADKIEQREEMDQANLDALVAQADATQGEAQAAQGQKQQNTRFNWDDG